MANPPDRPPEPPRWLTGSLQLLLPERREARAALGDLHEGWLRRRGRDGRRAATLWYAAQGLSLLKYRLPGRPRVRPEIGTDLLRSLRAMVRKPLLLVTGLLTLGPALAATGLGAALAWAVFLRPLPYPEADRLVVVEHNWAGFGATGISTPLYDFYRESSRSVEKLGLVASWEDVNARLGESEPLRLDGARVTASTLELLGARPIHGRLFGPDDDRAGGSAVVILTHDLWVEAFGADPTVVGTTLEVDGAGHTVVGVLAEGLEVPDGDPRIFLPARIDRSRRSILDLRWSFGLARRAPAVDADGVEEELTALLGRIVTEAPDESTTPAMLEENRIRPLVTELKSWETARGRDFLLLLIGSVLLLLILACAAMANVFLGRSEARAGELRLRRTLGATTSRVFLHVLADAFVLCAAAGAVGAWGAAVLTRTVLGSSALDLPRTELAGLPTGAAVAALAVAGILVPAFALVPLRQARLSEGVGTTTRVTPWTGARKVLLGAQVAVSVVLLVATLSLATSVRSLAEAPLGFRGDGVLTFDVTLPETSYPDRIRTREFHRKVVEEIGARPGVVGVAYADGVPLSPQPWSGAVIQIQGEEESPTHQWGYVSAGFLDVLDVSLRAGRGLRPSDVEEARPVVVVNEALARLHWDDPASAIGRYIRRRGGEGLEVVGVVANTAGAKPGTDQAPLVYAPASRSPFDMRYTTYVVRTSTDAGRLRGAVRQVMAEVDAGLPVFNMRTMAQRIDAVTIRERLALRGIGMSGAASVIVAVASLVGLVLLSLLQRRREIGVRKAVGATDPHLRWLLLRGVLLPMMGGLLLGAGVVLLGVTVPDSLLHGADGPVHPLLATVTGLVAFLGTAALVASLRVARVEPAEALRAE